MGEMADVADDNRIYDECEDYLKEKSGNVAKPNLNAVLADVLAEINELTKSDGEYIRRSDVTKILSKYIS